MFFLMYSPVVVAGSNTHHKLSFKLSNIYIYNSTVHLYDDEEKNYQRRQGNQQEKEHDQGCGRPCSNFHLCQAKHPEFWRKAGDHVDRSQGRGHVLHPALRKHAVVEGGGSVLPEVEPQERPSLVRTPDVHSDKRDGPDVFSEGFRGRYPEERRPDLSSLRSKSGGSVGSTVPNHSRARSNGILLPLKLSINGLNRSKRESPGQDSGGG